MKRIVFLILVLIVIPLFGKKKLVWSSGSITVVSSDKWCGTPEVARDGGICGPKNTNAAIQFATPEWGGPQPPNPAVQLLEIESAGSVYMVKREGLDGGLRFAPGATTQFAVDGKHLLIRFEKHEKVTRRGEPPIHLEEDRTLILVVRKQ